MSETPGMTPYQRKLDAEGSKLILEAAHKAMIKSAVARIMSDRKVSELDAINAVQSDVEADLNLMEDTREKFLGTLDSMRSEAIEEPDSDSDDPFGDMITELDEEFNSANNEGFAPMPAQLEEVEDDPTVDFGTLVTEKLKRMGESHSNETTATPKQVLTFIPRTVDADFEPDRQVVDALAFIKKSIKNAEMPSILEAHNRAHETNQQQTFTQLLSPDQRKDLEAASNYTTDYASLYAYLETHGLKFALSAISDELHATMVMIEELAYAQMEAEQQAKAQQAQ